MNLFDLEEPQVTQLNHDLFQSLSVWKVYFNYSAENDTGPTDLVNNTLKIMNQKEL